MRESLTKSSTASRPNCLKQKRENTANPDVALGLQIMEQRRGHVELLSTSQQLAACLSAEEREVWRGDVGWFSYCLPLILVSL